MFIDPVKPIVFLSLKGTSVNYWESRLIQASFVRLFKDEDTGVIERDQHSWIINPETDIPPYVARQTGITNEIVRNAPKLDDLVPTIDGLIFDAILVSYDALDRDVPLLMYNLERVTGESWDWMWDARIIDTKKLYINYRKPQLSNAVKDMCGYELSENSDIDTEIEAVMNLTDALARAFNMKEPEQIAEEVYPADYVDFYGLLKRNSDGVIVFNFGRWKGIPVMKAIDVAVYFIERNFPQQTKEIMLKILRGEIK